MEALQEQLQQQDEQLQRFIVAQENVAVAQVIARGEVQGGNNDNKPPRISAVKQYMTQLCGSRVKWIVGICTIFIAVGVVLGIVLPMSSDSRTPEADQTTVGSTQTIVPSIGPSMAPVPQTLPTNVPSTLPTPAPVEMTIRPTMTPFPQTLPPIAAPTTTPVVPVAPITAALVPMTLPPTTLAPTFPPPPPPPPFSITNFSQ